ncbi:hypothetical protein E5Q_03321 [Mixia osmundae IAM 14324]|uniref:Transcription factor CBF/NF-Y/archaeal histone domain-containing protein n=1 Tax=Mixia osmundae (strain CBS 9802 / IAM 14324 / JCM 22182 / KY 12970) TaxID=764103 RepID=G7E1E0_MIXOS|nr:hypothetical protein E5Q_03321 [Mixia osmundae IAM 14324]
MADDELAGPSGALEEDLGMPKATVGKVITEILANEDITCSKESRDLIADFCKEFITLISSEANEICEKGSRKTIAPEHVIAALKSLGFERYVEEVEEATAENKQNAKTREKAKKTTKLDSSGMTEEELLQKQEQLFAASRARYDATQ